MNHHSPSPHNHAHHKPSAPKKEAQLDFWTYVKNPKIRPVIYGVTNRQNDPWYAKLNDLLLDHQSLALKDKSRFFHSLKLLVNSGVQFIRALEMLSERTKHVRFSRILKTIAYDMEHNGMAFSEAIQKYPPIFSQSEVKMIYSGELTGKIDKTLESIATQLQKNIELEMKVRSALMYPATVMVAIVLAGAAVMLFIVPKLSGLFNEFGAELPFATKLLVGMSNFMVSFWWLLLFMAMATYFGFTNWRRSEEGKRKWDRLMVTLPIVSPIVNHIQTVRISSNFATLMESGIPLNKALRVLAEIVPNSVISDALFNIEVEVRKGSPLHESFLRQEVLDPVIGEMVEVGEKTGQIAPVLKKLGEQYDLEVEAQLKNLSTVIEPLIILVVGLAVVFMMFAVLTPIFQMQQLFSTT